jgi:PRC-barrel domain
MTEGDYGDPVSYLVLEEGTDVHSSDGERVGTVEHVLADAEDDIFDGIIIDTRDGPGGWRFADAPQVDRIYERAVVLKVPAADVPSLPEPSANPPAVEHHGVEDSESPLEAKLRRAWDLISGRY